MSIRILGVIAVVVTVFAWATAPVKAGSRYCGDHDVLTEKLSSGYNEGRTGMGVVGSRSVVELFTAESGTWTIIVTKADGTSCIVAAGHSWGEFKRKPKLSGL